MTDFLHSVDLEIMHKSMDELCTDRRRQGVIKLIESTEIVLFEWVWTLETRGEKRLGSNFGIVRIIKSGFVFVVEQRRKGLQRLPDRISCRGGPSLRVSETKKERCLIFSTMWSILDQIWIVVEI